MGRKQTLSRWCLLCAYLNDNEYSILKGRVTLVR